jgi:hypothetical protein
MRPLRLAAPAVLALACAALAAPGPRGDGGATVELPVKDPLGRAAVIVPERSDAGDWDGTWVFVTRDARYALWLRTEEGKVRTRLRFQSVSTPEAFETGWDGNATYTLAGYPVTFALGLDAADAKTLAGRWAWDAEFPDSARKETGTFEAFRSGDGRSLVLRFKSFERTVRRRDDVRTYRTLPVWTFRKVSKREVLWDEIPF